MGVDDWQRGDPAGLGGDPSAAASGFLSWGTDLTGVGANSGRYENLVRSYLVSPPIDCSKYSEVTLVFQRWLGVQKHDGMVRDVASVIVNADTVWRNPFGTNLLDGAWTEQVIDISRTADWNAAVQITFALKSDNATVYCGWNIDDVRLSGIRVKDPTGVPPPLAGGPAGAIALAPAAPNPFRGETTIRFRLPRDGAARLVIYDLSGRAVATLVEDHLTAGVHQARWDGRSDADRRAAAGVYVYRVEQRGASASGRVTLLR
jgi:hypothetical protein